MTYLNVKCELCKDTHTVEVLLQWEMAAVEMTHTHTHTCILQVRERERKKSNHQLMSKCPSNTIANKIEKENNDRRKKAKRELLALTQPRMN